MKLKLLLIFLVLNVVGLAQNYHALDTTDVIWNERFEVGEPPFNAINYYSYYIDGDTIILNQKWFKIYERHNEQKIYIGCFREENKEIYYQGTDAWSLGIDSTVLLYDFNKSIGDTITTHWQRNIITDIDSIQIKNSYRKRFTINNSTKWIEGIGCTSGLLYPITDIITGYSIRELTCFKKNNEILYLNPNFTDCDTRVGIKLIPDSEEILVYPNPIIHGQKITIEHPKNTISKLNLFNSTGRLIYSKKEIHSKSFEISLFNVPEGLLLLEVADSQENIYYRKIISKK